MRITHLIASQDPTQGGPPVIAQNLALAQQALGHEVRLASEIVVDFPVTCVRLPHHRGLDLFRPPKPEVQDLLRNTDILHIHGVWEPVLPAVAKAARHAGCPYVLTPHGMLDPWSLAQKKWKKKIGLAIGYRTMLNGAAALHLGNEDERKLLEPLRLRPPYELIGNGILLSDLNPPPDPQMFRSRYLDSSDRPYILFLSRLHYKKGLDYLISAFAAIANKHPDVDLVIAGPDGGEEKTLPAQIEQLGLRKRTRLTGPLYGADKWSALAGATVFCLPSRQEGFSVAILEAMACRVAVVISDHCHFPQVAEFGAGLVVPLEMKKVADALDWMLSNPADRQRMGRAGRELIESRYTWERIADQLLGLYRRVGARSPV